MLPPRMREILMRVTAQYPPYMSSFRLIPEQSTVRIDGSSSVHAIHAESAGLTGEIDVTLTSRGLKAGSVVSGWVEIEVARLRASNPLVEAETKRRIDAKRFPTIRGTLTAAPVGTSTTALASGEVGTITFRGITAPVEGELVIEREGDTLHLTGSQRFDIRNWDLQPPKILLLKVSPMITVTIDAYATPA